jgi:hypothetical protein
LNWFESTETLREKNREDSTDDLPEPAFWFCLTEEDGSRRAGIFHVPDGARRLLGGRIQARANRSENRKHPRDCSGPGLRGRRLVSRDRGSLRGKHGLHCYRDCDLCDRVRPIARALRLTCRRPRSRWSAPSRSRVDPWSALPSRASDHDLKFFKNLTSATKLGLLSPFISLIEYSLPFRVTLLSV